MADRQPPVSGGSGGCWQAMEAKGLPTRDPPETPPALEAAAADLSVTGSKHSQAAADGRGIRVRQAPESPHPTAALLRNPFASVLCYCSAICYFLGGEMLMGGRWSGRNAAWPLGGPPRFMGLDFYRLGRGPRQALWSLTEEQTHKTSRHESQAAAPPGLRVVRDL